MKCVVCEEEITNPLCPQCLHGELRQWLLEQGEERLAAQVEARCDAPHGDIACIRCKRPMAVCTYCCTQDVLPLVRSKTKLLAQYLMYFNFDLGHFGWEQEARAYLNES